MVNNTIIKLYLKTKAGNSLVVWWLGLCSFTAKGPGSVPGWGTKILQALWRGQKYKQKTKALSFLY